MIEAKKGQHYFEVQNGNLVYDGKFIGMEDQSLVPGIVAGRDEPSWSRTALILGVFGVIAIPGIWFLDREYRMLSVPVGAILAIATSKIYDHFSKIRHLFQRRMDKQSLIS